MHMNFVVEHMNCGRIYELCSPKKLDAEVKIWCKNINSCGPKYEGKKKIILDTSLTVLFFGCKPGQD